MFVIPINQKCDAVEAEQVGVENVEFCEVEQYSREYCNEDGSYD